MPLNAAAADAVAAQIVADVLALPKATATSQDYWQAAVRRIFAGVALNAVVNTVDAVASVSGVTVGAGVSGPGTGTGVGTVS